MTLSPPINVSLDSQLHTKLFDVEHEVENDGIGDTTLGEQRSWADKSNEDGTNYAVTTGGNSGGSLSLSGESSRENKGTTDSRRRDDDLQLRFPPKVKKDETDLDEAISKMEKAASERPSPGATSQEKNLFGNNEKNDSWSQDDLLPPFPLLDVAEEDPNEIFDEKRYHWS